MQREPLTQKFEQPTNFKLYSSILVAALVLGVIAGFVLANSTNAKQSATKATVPASQSSLQKAQADSKTFDTFEEGTVQKKSSGSDYSEGTHILVDAKGKQIAALTSSVLDLNQYVGKKVKVYGSTQKAVEQGFLMDVGRVDVE